MGRGRDLTGEEIATIVYEGGRQYSTRDELKTAILAAWARISAEYRHKLYISMNTRLQSVINDGEIITDY